MRTVTSWAEYFMGMARHAATRSKDPNTNVGAVIVDEGRNVVSTGYNGFAAGLRETELRWERPTKYDFVIHAEQNAIGRAARRGVKVEGATMYVTHWPCKECMKMILAAGIAKVVIQKGVLANMTSADDAVFVLDRFNEAGVVVVEC